MADNEALVENFWLIDEKWRLYTAGRRGKQGTLACMLAIATAGPSGHSRARLRAVQAARPVEPGRAGSVDRR
jgi:hypothetical protein